jgi:hypothetical protein
MKFRYWSRHKKRESKVDYSLPAAPEDSFDPKQELLPLGEA